jgi:hypothetical protein
VLEAKYSTLAAEVIGKTQADELLTAVWALNGTSDVRQVTTLMVKG